MRSALGKPGTLLAVFGFAGWIVALGGAGQRFDTLEAKRLVILDDAERPAIRLDTEKGMNRLQFLNRDGRPSLDLAFHQDGKNGALMIQDSAGRVRLMAALSDDSTPSVSLYDARGEMNVMLAGGDESDTSLVFFGGNGNPRLVVGVQANPESPVIEVCRENGNGAIVLGLDGETIRAGIHKPDTAPFVSFYEFDKNDHRISYDPKLKIGPFKEPMERRGRRATEDDSKPPSDQR